MVYFEAVTKEFADCALRGFCLNERVHGIVYKATEDRTITHEGGVRDNLARIHYSDDKMNTRTTKINTGEYKS